MRIGMRLPSWATFIAAVAAVFVLSIFVQEIKPGVRRATEGDVDWPPRRCWRRWPATIPPSGNLIDGQLAKAFAQSATRPFRANISGTSKCAMNTMST